MKKKKRLKELIAAIATVTGVFSVVTPASAVSLQSNEVWDDLTDLPVQSRTTDMSGFQELIPEFKQFVQPEGIAIPANQSARLDPSRLQLVSDSNVRVWFLNEGADYRNQLAYEAVVNDSVIQQGLIFEDASCIAGGQYNCERSSADGVLNVGDYVDLGTIPGGSQLNFWLRANGDNPQSPAGTNPVTNEKYIYGPSPEVNPDNLEHIVSYEYQDYVVIGFEDLFGPEGFSGGGNVDLTADRDFNDVVFVVDVGKNNLDGTAYVPEPGTVLAILAVGAVGTLQLRRSRSRV
ncbi:MAG: DUF4114 domain-containing protein [Scytonema sp. PMC 1070.18]|nr:DUF4114 domain-containing protein [Scytonema sp. PMC 1070.18]